MGLEFGYMVELRGGSRKLLHCGQRCVQYVYLYQSFPFIQWAIPSTSIEAPRKSSTDAGRDHELEKQPKEGRCLFSIFGTPCYFPKKFPLYTRPEGTNQVLLNIKLNKATSFGIVHEIKLKCCKRPPRIKAIRELSQQPMQPHRPIMHPRPPHSYSTLPSPLP